MNNYDGSVHYFDKIRKGNGDEKLKGEFYKLVKNDTKKVIVLLNSDTISFPTFYVLIPQMKELNLFNSLNKRNQYAIQFCENKRIKMNQPIAHETFKWILTSSALSEIEEDNFEEIVDQAAIKLLLCFNDKSVLQTVADLIFVRNRKEKYIHDLTWCFFQSKQIDTMPLIAKYIKSNDKKDNELAYQLLNFKPELQPNDKTEQYNNFNKWLHENQAFLYSTGDQMQQTSSPKFWRVDLPSKYLCNPAFNNKSLTMNLQEHLDYFKHINKKDQKILAKYSYRIYSKDKSAWEKWMKAPINTQLEIAKKELGGLS